VVSSLIISDFLSILIIRLQLVPCFPYASIYCRYFIGPFDKRYCVRHTGFHAERRWLSGSRLQCLGDRNNAREISKIAEVDDSGGDVESRKRYVVVIVRSDYKFTNNKSDYRRWWPEKDLLVLIEELRRCFPTHKIKIFSDRDEELMTCIKCHIELFYRADIVIGHHGAGLMNALYQRTGGIVMEILPYFDSRHAPLTGIFSRVSGKIRLNFLLGIYAENYILFLCF
jgi:hypothetical protein